MKRIDYHGPRGMQESIETFVQERIRPHIARDGVVPFYVGKIDHIEMRPVPHFIFDEEKNRRVEEALEKYAHTEPSEQERIYQEVRQTFLNTSPSWQQVGGGYQQGVECVFFAPHHILDYLHISSLTVGTIDWKHISDDKWRYYFSGLNFPHAIAHEVVHWDLADTMAWKDLREEFASLEEFAVDDLVMDEKSYEEIAREDSNAEEYSGVFKRMIALQLYHFSEVIAECVGNAIVPTPDKLIHPTVKIRDDVIEKVHRKIQSGGIKETLAFAKQLMDDAYRTEVPVYNLLRRA